MSFKKGEYYECIDNGGGAYPATIGKVYECLRDDIYMSCVADDGHLFTFSGRRFKQRQSGPAFNHAAALQQQELASMAQPTTKPGTVPMCKCGATPKLQTYMTFSYYYCSACKVEVGGKAAKSEPKEEPKAAPEKWHWSMALPPITPTLPQGMSALHGEPVTCFDCGVQVGKLQGDLPEMRSPARWSSYRHILYSGTCACPISAEVKTDPATLNSFINVKGRGWV